MRFSKKSQYGLRAMTYLAQVFEKNMVCSIREISKKENISFDYLEKIISKLEKNNLVKSKKGAKGGYCLAFHPKKIKVGKIIRVLEDRMAPVECIALEKDKKYNCPHKRKCKTIGLWSKVQDSLNSTLNSISLADLIKK